MSAPADWKVRDGLALLRAANALFAQAEQAGQAPDLDTYTSLVRMLERLTPPGTSPDECPLFARAIPPALRIEPSHDVLTNRHYLRQDLQSIVDMLAESENAGPYVCTQALVRAVTQAQLFLDGLRASLNMVLDERASGGVH